MCGISIFVVNIMISFYFLCNEANKPHCHVIIPNKKVALKTIKKRIFGITKTRQALASPIDNDVLWRLLSPKLHYTLQLTNDNPKKQSTYDNTMHMMHIIYCCYPLCIYKTKLILCKFFLPSKQPNRAQGPFYTCIYAIFAFFYVFFGS